MTKAAAHPTPCPNSVLSDVANVCPDIADLQDAIRAINLSALGLCHVLGHETPDRDFAALFALIHNAECIMERIDGRIRAIYEPKKESAA